MTVESSNIEHWSIAGQYGGELQEGWTVNTLLIQNYLFIFLMIPLMQGQVMKVLRL
ncbi:hypothetical protein JCM19039_1320 [Geomicrobium sp. JCM 19039]|nr:hypothetical protein JCM19039_1320 [Geomicrobium sp. JCM 19039]